jgi:hypothetical protein
MKNLSAALDGVIARYEGAETTSSKRRPGRPTKRTPEYLAELLATHEKVVAWYLSQFGCEPASDRQLYTEYFASCFAAEGGRASRARSDRFQSKLKTLRNELAEARHRERPSNPSVSGTTPVVQLRAEMVRDARGGSTWK